MVGWQLQILSYLCVTIVALLVMTFELFESVLILASRPVLRDEDLGGLGSLGVLQVVEDFKGTSLRDRAIVRLIGLPVLLISKAELGSILVDEEGDRLLAMPADRD